MFIESCSLFFPKEEKFGLVDQLRRASESVGANIAEGAGRFYYLDNVRFSYNARGSLDETLNLLILSKDLEYCPIDLHRDLRDQIEEIRRVLNGYVAWLKAKKVGESEPGAKLVIREFAAEYLIETDIVAS
jgi:four helix bundle protein